MIAARAADSALSGHQPRRARVQEALRAARARPARPFVRTAFLAAAFKDPAPRLRAADRACCARAFGDAAPGPSRRSARWIARARLLEGLRPERARLNAYSALRRVSSEVGNGLLSKVIY